jgi:hypothetical protein
MEDKQLRDLKPGDIFRVVNDTSRGVKSRYAFYMYEQELDTRNIIVWLVDPHLPWGIGRIKMGKSKVVSGYFHGDKEQRVKRMRQVFEKIFSSDVRSYSEVQDAPINIG